jgi:bla regulator protein blaR1
MMALLLKIVLASACMTGIYFLLLAKQKSFRFNRWYLLLSLLLPLMVPFIELEITASPAETVVQNYMQTLYVVQDAITIGSETSVVPVGAPVLYTATDFLFLGFLLISLLLLLRYVYCVHKLVQLKKSALLVKREQLTIALSEEVKQPFSFLSTMYVNMTAFENNEIPNDILLHETAHCEQWHSLDVLFSQLLLVFTWWNPLNWLLLRTIRQNHEFLADEKVVTTKPDDTVSYLQLLLQSASTQLYSSMVSEFNYAFIKKRFTMIQKKNSRHAALYTLTSMLICLVVLGCFMSFRYKAVMNPSVVERRVDTVAPNKSFDTYLEKNTFAYSEKGVSAEEMALYKSITDKYEIKREDGKKKWVEISKEDKARLKDIFGRMSKEQQRGQRIRFMKQLPPFAKNTPTTKQFENFKKADVYGVWLDDKKVSNEILNQYTNSDFAHYSVSKLYGAAKKGRNYTHQVNLMTKKAYDDYLTDKRKNAHEPIMFMSWRPYVAVVEKTK